MNPWNWRPGKLVFPSPRRFKHRETVLGRLQSPRHCIDIRLKHTPSLLVTTLSRQGETVILLNTSKQTQSVKENKETKEYVLNERTK